MGGGDLVEAAGKKRRQGKIRADGDQAVGERFEEMPWDGCGLLSGDGFFGVRRGVLGKEFAEVGIAPGIFDVEEEGIGAPACGTAFVVGFSRMGTEFDAEDRFDAGFFGGEDEFDDAVEVAGIGEGDGWAMVLDGEVDDIARREGGVEKGVVAVNAQGGGGAGGRRFGKPPHPPCGHPLPRMGRGRGRMVYGERVWE